MQELCLFNLTVLLICHIDIVPMFSVEECDVSIWATTAMGRNGNGLNYVLPLWRQSF